MRSRPRSPRSSGSTRSATTLRIVYLDACFEFPFDVTRALELAFFRTFAVPSIAELLASTGEFTDRPLKRYDDTDLLISSFVEEGYDSPAGRAAIRRMNQLHGRFEIANEDFLYVLSTLALEPFRWNERFGWRRATEAERTATLRVLAERRPSDEHPRRPAELRGARALQRRVRARAVRVHRAGHRVASAMVDMFVGKFPGMPKALGRRGVYALLDDPLLDALGLARTRRGGAARRRGRAQAARARASRCCRRGAVRACGRRCGAARRTRTARRSPRSARPRLAAAETGYRPSARPRSSVDRAADFESARGGSTPPGAI